MAMMMQNQMMARMREEEMRRRARLPEQMVVAAISGWRRWSVEMFGEILLSNNGTKWEPCKRLMAECKRQERAAYMRAYANSNPLMPPMPEEDTCKGVRCGCGIYAYKHRITAETQENAPSETTHIFGEVWLWGRIVEHEGGYRAQFAYPKAFVRTGIAERMAHVYGAKLIG